MKQYAKIQDVIGNVLNLIVLNLNVNSFVRILIVNLKSLVAVVTEVT